MVYELVASDFTFGQIWTDFKSMQFWQPVLIYLSAGVLYSIVEFFFAIRREANLQKGLWASHLKNTEAGLLFKMLEDGSISDTNREELLSLTRSYVRVQNARVKLGSIVSYDIDQKAAQIQAQVVPQELLDAVTAWVILWPAYLVSLILGDFVTWIFESIRDTFISVSRQFIKITFSNIFKY